MFKSGWDAVINFFYESYVKPFVDAWEASRDLFEADWIGFFTQTIPRISKIGWDAVIDFFYESYARPFVIAWAAVRDFFKDNFTAFFTTTIPEAFKGGWVSVLSIFRGVFQYTAFLLTGV